MDENINILIQIYPKYKFYNKKQLIKLFFKHYYTFDYNFYINFYFDLKNKNFNDAYRHWILYGVKENRICNQFRSYYNLIKNINIIKNYNLITFHKKENKINILIRTSNRKDYFNECLNSILKQNYINYNIIVSYDDDNTKKYLIKNNYVKYIFIDKTKYKTKYFFNDYMNILHKHIDDGFIIYLDDDDQLAHPNSLKIINEHINNINDILIFKFLRPDKCIFPIDINNIQLGDISTSNFCYHSNFKNIIKWEQIQCADYYYFINLINSYPFNNIFINFIISKRIDQYKTGNFGITDI